MSSLKLKHSGGNSVSLNPPTSAPTSSDVAFKLPNADGSADQYIKTDGSGNLGWATIATPTTGITDFDTWHVTASVDSNQLPIENNWSRWTGYGGTGSVTFAAPSSGIWTFPSTGYWLIMFTAFTYKNDGSERGCNTSIYVTTDNSSYSFASEASTNIHDADAQSKGHAMVSYILDVTDTSQVKIKLYQGYQASGTTLYGHGSYLLTNVKFLKLRET